MAGFYFVLLRECLAIRQLLFGESGAASPSGCVDAGAVLG
jgi:hypothetical protein